MGAALVRLSFASVVAACCFPIPIAPSTTPTAGCATAPLRRPSPIAASTCSTTPIAASRARSTEKGGRRKIVEHARQILLQTATRRFADAWIGSRHARDQRAPRRILERPFDEGVAAEGDAQQSMATGKGRPPQLSTTNELHCDQ